MRQPTCIVLTPRFNDGNFAGYDQVTGDTFDAYGQLYTFVQDVDYNELIRELEEAHASAEIWKAKANHMERLLAEASGKANAATPE